MATAKVDQSVDIRGQICPYTLILTRDALKKMAKGQALEVVCDYEPAATETIPNFCEKKGYPLESVQEAPGLWKLRIERTD
ncbi:MAG: sulfurtransferase TusA family protein [Dehalococcoidia bacterium]|nr:sulfurtransferase TusA family protein [Dehalococcoidia bacterium]